MTNKNKQCDSFYVDVANLLGAEKVLNILSGYDYPQFKNSIKSDYSDTVVFEMFEDDDWEDEETGAQDTEEYFEFINEEL